MSLRPYVYRPHVHKILELKGYRKQSDGMISPDMQFWLGVSLGLPVTIFGAWLYDIMKDMHTKRNEKLQIEGSWGEYVKDAKDRQFSLGRIYFDKKREIWAFDGTNFLNNGTPFCHWYTLSSHLDLTSQQFFYIFDTKVEGELDRSYHGFGVVHLARDQRGFFVPANGYYVSANVDGKGMSHSMIRSTELIYDRSVAGKDVVKMVREATRTTKLVRGVR